MRKSKQLGTSMTDNRLEKLEEIGAIARMIGWGSADILTYYHTDAAGKLKVREKKEGPVTNADVAANEYILQKLRIAFGSLEFGYLSEESYQSHTNGDRRAHQWVWIIDPIDGTRAYIEQNPNYAVHIALVYEGQPVVAVVAVPSAQKLYYAQRGGGAFVETRSGDRTPVKVSSRDRLQDLCLLTRRTRKGEKLDELLQRLPCQTQQYMGSIGCKIAAIVEQQVDGFISLSGRGAPKDWDFAAPELILTEAGGQLTFVDGTPLRYNQKDVNQWGCAIASNAHCHEALCQEVEKILATL
ncbi:3'(2'),5'-bisphosphate nucleotidase CysQ [Laspinema sp. D2d]|uniref:3'(2'),5'-bisphosphate nucleotidase CysQ family protein n=1 Tax=Laspinema sp. D2d TaxID=2953686 RepID=UPI0021BAD189|nr:inositol monophosphatase family protein [Laspinema sp. D2d]